MRAPACMELMAGGVWGGGALTATAGHGGVFTELPGTSHAAGAGRLHSCGVCRACGGSERREHSRDHRHMENPGKC